MNLSCGIAFKSVAKRNQGFTMRNRLGKSRSVTLAMSLFDVIRVVGEPAFNPANDSREW